MYGTSRTGEHSQDTIAHVVRPDGKRSLCGSVLIWMTLNSLAGWNLCLKCREIGKVPRGSEA